MKIIIPMAGMGKRMRPHTLTIPKPLIPVAGEPIVKRLVDDIVDLCDEQIEEIAYVIGDFGVDVENNLKQIANDIGAKATIYYQHDAFGTAHAIYCAKESLEGNIVVAFADTLFKTDFKLDKTKDGIIWVHKVGNPESFGVVKVNENQIIGDFIEKPPTFVSDLAIIGIYYFKDGAYLRKEIEHLLDNDIKDKGEFQLTSALENMKEKGTNFVAGEVTEWLDCGNKDATLETNKRMLELNIGNGLIDPSLFNTGSSVIPPCFVGKNVQLVDSVVGPFVSIGENSIVKNSVIKNSIVQSNSRILSANIHNSMIGNHVEYYGNGNETELSIGDYCIHKSVSSNMKS